MKKHIIINVGRQLGSGGRIIGNRIAEDFNIKFYDKELLDLAAKESGFNKKFFERNDEHKGFLKVLFSSFAPIFGNSDPYANQLSDESLFKFQSDAIRKAGGPSAFALTPRQEEPRSPSKARVPTRCTPLPEGMFGMCSADHISGYQGRSMSLFRSGIEDITQSSLSPTFKQRRSLQGTSSKSHQGYSP